MSHRIKVGELFESFQELQETIWEMERETKSTFVIQDCCRISSRKAERFQEKVPLDLQKKLIYERLTFACQQGRQRKSRSKGERNAMSTKLGCTACIKAVLRQAIGFEDSWCFQLRSVKLHHNAHDPSKEVITAKRRKYNIPKKPTPFDRRAAYYARVPDPNPKQESTADEYSNTGDEGDRDLFDTPMNSTTSSQHDMAAVMSISGEHTYSHRKPTSLKTPFTSITTPLNNNTGPSGIGTAKTPCLHVTNKPTESSRVPNPPNKPSSTYDIVCDACNSDIRLNANELKKLYRHEYINNILLSDNNCFHYTGFPTARHLHSVFDWLSPSVVNMKRIEVEVEEVRRVLDHKSEFILTLVKIRRGLDNRSLADAFRISKSAVKEIFFSWVPFLESCMSPLITWPTKEACQASLTGCFSDFPNTRAIIAVAKYTIDIPLTSTTRSHGDTVKQLVAVAPSGCITFLSSVYGDGISDVVVVEKSGFFEYLEVEDSIVSDESLNVEDVLLQNKANSNNIPSPSPSKMSSHNGGSGAEEIHPIMMPVKRAMRMMKSFRILDGSISSKLRRSLHSITRIVAFLCNVLDGSIYIEGME